MKTAYFPIVTAPQASYKRERKQNWCLSPPSKPDFDPYSYDTTVISKTFWMKSYTMMQHEIVPKFVENIFIICKLFF